MKDSSKKGIFLAIVLHGLVVFGVVAWVWAGSLSPKKPERHVFKLESVPKVAVVKEVNKNEVKVVTAKPVKQKPKEVVKSKKSTISYRDFVKKQGKPKASKPKAVVAKVVVVPKIKTKDVKKVLDEKIKRSARVSEEALSAYEALVRSRIDAYWEQPGSFLGYQNSAVMDFDIDVSGRIIGVRIVKSSGSATFDESVKNAFEKIGRVGVPPNGKVNRFEMIFSRK